MSGNDKSTTFNMDGKHRKKYFDESDNEHDNEHDSEHDNAVSERSRPEEIRRITAIPTPDVSPRQDEDVINTGSGTKSASVSNHLGVQHAAARDHSLNARPQEFIVRTGTSVSRPNSGTRRDNIGNRDWRDESSRGGLSPAAFEANELRRTENYKRENTRFDKVHDGALTRSFTEGRPLLKYWEDSRLERPMKKQRTQTVCEVPETAATLKNGRNQAQLERQRSKLSLSPVLPIRPPAPEDEADSLDLHGTGLWPIDLPEPRTGKPPLAHVAWPPTIFPQTVRRSTSHLPEGERPQALRERYLTRQYHAERRKMEGKMSEEELSVFFEF
ncbi:hypothetical protein PMIN03_007129 [Paraphaeosphaeria minitans]